MQERPTDGSHFETMGDHKMIAISRLRRGIPVHWINLLTLTFVLGLAGCGGGGGGGGDVAGGGGDDVADGGGAGGLAVPANLVLDDQALNFGINGVAIASPPVVDFCVTTTAGDGVALSQDDVDGRSLRFTIAKLVAGTDGDPDSWQSYILSEETTEAGDPGPGGAPALASAVQASAETGDGAGTLESNEAAGPGCYLYTFATDVTAVPGVTFDEAATHRVAMQVELEGAEDNQGNPTEFVGNPYFDFVPNGADVSLTKEVVLTETCNACHNNLQLHGGGRREVEYCVTCHNPGTTDANSGENLDFAVLIHKIHAGEELTVNSDGDPDNDYVIWGYNNSAHDYSTVVFPQMSASMPGLVNCESCHTGSDPNWRTRPSMNACSACHDDVDFTGGGAHPEVTDNSDCNVCHVQFDSDLQIVNAHTDPVQVLADRMAYDIQDVSFDGTNLTIDFQVLVDGVAQNIKADTAEYLFTQDGVNLLVGWPTEDYSNEGAGNDLAQPLRNPSFGAGGVFTNAVNQGGNVFRVTADIATGNTLPGTGTGVIGFDGHPHGLVDGVDEELPVVNAVAHFSFDGGAVVARRNVVSNDSCNVCHGNLSLHGGNRNGNVQHCVICHNANATDMEVRPFDAGGTDGIDVAATPDGKVEEAIHFKHMIHAIHAGEEAEHGLRENGIVVYGYNKSTHDYSHVRYPQSLANCAACHDGDTYTLESQPENALATTIDSGAMATAANPGFPASNALSAEAVDPADDLNISPEAATCHSCHDGAQSHMEILGDAVFDQTQDVIDSTVFEACDQCHGENGPVPVSGAHAALVP